MTIRVLSARELGVVTIVGLLWGCGGSRGTTTSSSASPAAAIEPSASPFALEGTIKERGAGPLSGVNVTARFRRVPPDQNTRKILTTTNEAGQFRIEGLTEATILDFEKAGYEGSWSARALDRNTRLNVMLDRIIRIEANGSVAATIWGDDDVWDEAFGNLCHSPCRLIHLETGGPGTITAQLQPVYEAHRLGLYIDIPGPGGRSVPATDVPGSDGTLNVSAALPPCWCLLVVQLLGAGRNDHQDFTLTTTFVSE
jgi:hypothetical protein